MSIRLKVKPFEVKSIEEVINTFPIVFHSQTENRQYYIDRDYQSARESIRLFKIVKFPEIKDKCLKIGHLKTDLLKTGESRGIVFTNNVDQIGILYAPKSAKIPEDYTLVIRTGNDVLYCGGIIPGLGYQVKKSLHLNLNEKFTWPNLSNPEKKYPNHFPDLLPLVAGYNPHFD